MNHLAAYPPGESPISRRGIFALEAPTSCFGTFLAMVLARSDVAYP